MISAAFPSSCMWESGMHHLLSLLLQSWLFETDSLDGLVSFTTHFCIKYIHYIIPELVIKQSVAQQNAGVPILLYNTSVRF